MIDSLRPKIGAGASAALDALRLAAALVVVVFHASSQWATAYPATHAALGKASHAAVVLFFVISGYVIAFTTAGSPRSARHYAVARLSRLYAVLVPVIRNADQKGLAQIATEVKELAGRAKTKKLQPAEWEGSTFTISNLGMFGIDEFTAIINPPDACILAVGGIKQTAIVKDGALAIGNIMKVTLSCDHRVVDGATGAAFLQTLKSLLEDPMRLMI